MKVEAKESNWSGEVAGIVRKWFRTYLLVYCDDSVFRYVRPENVTVVKEEKEHPNIIDTNKDAGIYMHPAFAPAPIRELNQNAWVELGRKIMDSKKVKRKKSVRKQGKKK